MVNVINEVALRPIDVKKHWDYNTRKLS